MISGLPDLPADAIGATIHGVSYTRLEYEHLQRTHRTIWKFDLHLEGVAPVLMPRGAVLLSIGVQHRGGIDVPVVWAHCDALAPVMRRVLAVRLTGGVAPEAGGYVGTFQLVDGVFVGHVFDLGEEPAP